jgi:hypothetical protein
MSILTLTALIVFTITMILLLAPVRLRFRADAGRQSASLRFLGIEFRVGYPEGYWVLSFLGFELRQGSIISPDRKRPVAGKKKPATKSRQTAFGNLAQLLWEHGPTLRRTLYLTVRLLGRLLRSWRFESGRVTLVFGVGDPAHTGMLSGYFYAMRGCLTHFLPALDINIQPNFNQRALQLTGALTLRIIPLRPIRHILQTLGTIPWRGLWKLKRAQAAQ